MLAQCLSLLKQFQNKSHEPIGVGWIMGCAEVPPALPFDEEFDGGELPDGSRFAAVFFLQHGGGTETGLNSANARVIIAFNAIPLKPMRGINPSRRHAQPS